MDNIGKICYSRFTYFLRMSFFGNKHSFLGVDIGAHGIKLVELKKNKNRPQLWTYGIIDEALDIHLDQPRGETQHLIVEAKKEEQPIQLEQEMKGKKPSVVFSVQDRKRIEEYSRLLKTLVKAARVSTTNVTASLPVSYIFHALLTMPIVDKRQLDPIVRAEVAKMLSRPIEDMQITHQMVPTTSVEGQEKYMKVLVTAAPKELVAFYTAIFQKAGLHLQELETEAFALERSLVGKDAAVSMIVDIGGERTNFFIIEQGLPLTQRTTQLGGDKFDELLMKQLGVDKKAVYYLKKDISLLPAHALTTPAFDELINEIVKEIQYTFDLFLNQMGNTRKRPEKIILTGGASFFPRVAERIQSKFAMKVFIGDPWGRVVYQQALKNILDTIGPRMAVSIGLAMRNIAP